MSCSQPLFPVDRAVRRNKGVGYTRPARLLFHAERYHFQYKLKAIMFCWTEEQTEEWSGHDRLHLVLHSFLLFWVLCFSDFSIGCKNCQGMTMKKTTVQLQLGGKPCILLQSTCTTIYQVITRVKQLIWSHKQAACPNKNFKEIIFVVEVKSMKTVKFFGLENFLLYGIWWALLTYATSECTPVCIYSCILGMRYAWLVYPHVFHWSEV